MQQSRSDGSRLIQSINTRMINSIDSHHAVCTRWPSGLVVRKIGSLFSFACADENFRAHQSDSACTEAIDFLPVMRTLPAAVCDDLSMVSTKSCRHHLRQVPGSKSRGLHCRAVHVESMRLACGMRMKQCECRFTCGGSACMIQL